VNLGEFVDLPRTIAPRPGGLISHRPDAADEDIDMNQAHHPFTALRASAFTLRPSGACFDSKDQSHDELNSNETDPNPVLRVYGKPANPDLPQASWFRVEDRPTVAAAALSLKFLVTFKPTPRERSPSASMRAC